MADADFKKHPISFPTLGWISHSMGSAIGQDKYRPDRSFGDTDGNVRCVIESSSTNDRKVGVGELCLADKFFSDSKWRGVLIFSLCGKALTRPKPETHLNYLRPYFLHLRGSEREFGVREIFVLDEADFAKLEWKALTPEFLRVALRLEA